MAVRVDGPKPDTSSAEAFKRSLLAAPAIIITDPATGGISGVHFASVLDRLGIAGEMKPKLKLLRGGSHHAQMVAKGEADLAVQAEHEIRCVPGIAFLPYPAEFQRTIVFTAGVGAGAKDAAAARALIQFMTGLDAAPALAAHCMRAGS
jgi:molybdate transport system substrate-binding protein